MTFLVFKSTSKAAKEKTDCLKILEDTSAIFEPSNWSLQLKWRRNREKFSDLAEAESTEEKEKKAAPSPNM